MRRANALWRARNQVEIRLVRKTRVSDGAGGKRKVSETTLPPQRFRIAATARQHEMTGETTEGRLQAADWVLVGAPDADVKKDDWFSHGGREWRVRFVDVSDRTRRSAGVVEHG